MNQNVTNHAMVLIGPEPSIFNKAFTRFQELINAETGNSFVSFDEGVAAVWENYKPRLRAHALELLNFDAWQEGDIGSGRILNSMIEAIEIQAAIGNITNNLVFWQNQFGHANRDHNVMLEAVSNAKLRHEIEDLIYGLFCGDADEDITFDALSKLLGGKYPLLAYIYFLKNMDRFMPIHPTGFDRAFRAIGLDFTTLRQCNWDNYSAYNQTLANLQPYIKSSAGLVTVRLIDAHSFCWIFATLLKLEAKGIGSKSIDAKQEGRFLGGREKSIIAMRISTENTVKNANGEVVQRTMKNKELRMVPEELEEHLACLLDVQNNRCNLTGLPFQFLGSVTDKNFLPSLDRIDSAGHYEKGNLQVVCQFINFWKSDADNDEFKGLLNLLRGVDL